MTGPTSPPCYNRKSFPHDLTLTSWWLFSYLYTIDKDYSQAEAHLLVGTQESAEALGLVLFAWSEEEPEHDKGAYLLRGVLQELAMRNLRDANTVYKTFVERLPAAYLAAEQKVPGDGSLKTIQTFKSPLLNLTQMLLLACQTGNPAIFKQVATKYKPVLAIDENFGAVSIQKKVLSKVKGLSLKDHMVNLSILFRCFSS